MKWPKDRKAAFLWAAKAFGTPISERTGKQRLVASVGFCGVIRELTDSLDIHQWACSFRQKAGMSGSVYWWPTRGQPTWTPSCDKERSLFCYLMAALSDKEFEEIAAKNT